MRISEAALALIVRPGPNGKFEYLTQWHERWRNYALIGGHIEPGETYRECCAREVSEELGIVPEIDFRVDSEPRNGRQEYTAYSKSADTLTLYRAELFSVELITTNAHRIINEDTANRWLTLNELENQVTTDGQRIADQVMIMFKRCGVFAD